MDKETTRGTEDTRISHLIVLISYTIFATVLAGESMLLGWEVWVLPIVFAGVAFSWVVHINQFLPENYRVWLYMGLMMGTFFFYGIHRSSIYDMAPVMCVVLIIFSMTGETGLINFGLATYYATLLYDTLIGLSQGTAEVDALLVTRTLLHILLVFMAGYTAKAVIIRAERERKEYSERIVQLEELNRRTEDFLANISHELRTPINVVTGITAVMLKREKNATSREQLKSVQDAGRRLYDTIGDILDLTEIDTGRMTVSSEPYRISSLINDLIADTRTIVSEGECDVIFDVDAKMPDIIIGDGEKIKKVLKHLMTNAIKFTKSGAVYIRLYGRRKPYGMNLCIQVSDTGIGMDNEEVERITESFYQADSGRNRTTGGLGLGLSIVNGLIKAMNGFMQIESEKDKGTTVKISIPQGVGEDRPCMEVENRSDLCLAGLIKPERFQNPRVLGFFELLVSNLVSGLELSLHKAINKEELEKLSRIYRLTHLFIGQAEYEENTTFIEELDEQILVVVIADDSFVPRSRSRVRILRKPFDSFHAVSFLNSDAYLGEYDPEGEKQMTCPGVEALVVDDEPMNLMVAEGIFRDYGMTVRTAGSGEEALRICEEEEFDLIFMDHMMPGMDGVETMKRLRQRRKSGDRNAAMIALTANAVSGAREMFLKEGFDGFIPKPIELTELERVLKKVLPSALIKYTDAENIQQDEKDDLLKALEAQGMDIREGLGYCRNDREFYIRLLDKFAKEMEGKKKEIDRLYGNEDWDNYRILVHALKSTAKMVGADYLSELARKAENASREKDVPYLKSHEEELISTYSETASSIGRVIWDTEGTAQKDKEDIGRADLIKKLTMLKECLDTYESSRAEELLQELSGYAYKEKPVSVMLEEADGLVGAFELEKASGKVGEMLSALQGGMEE